MSTCSKCDASLVDDDVFCTACGAAVESSQQVTTDPPVTPKVVEPAAAPTSPSVSIGAVFAKKNAKTLGIVGAAIVVAVGAFAVVRGGGDSVAAASNYSGPNSDMVYLAQLDRSGYTDSWAFTKVGSEERPTEMSDGGFIPAVLLSSDQNLFEVGGPMLGVRSERGDLQVVSVEANGDEATVLLDGGDDYEVFYDSDRKLVNVVETRPSGQRCYTGKVEDRLERISNADVCWFSPDGRYVISAEFESSDVEYEVLGIDGTRILRGDSVRQPLLTATGNALVALDGSTDRHSATLIDIKSGEVKAESERGADVEVLDSNLSGDVLVLSRDDRGTRTLEVLSEDGTATKVIDNDGSISAAFVHDKTSDVAVVVSTESGKELSVAVLESDGTVNLEPVTDGDYLSFAVLEDGRRAGDLIAVAQMSGDSDAVLFVATAAGMVEIDLDDHVDVTSVVRASNSARIFATVDSYPDDGYQVTSLLTVDVSSGEYEWLLEEWDYLAIEDVRADGKGLVVTGREDRRDRDEQAAAISVDGSPEFIDEADSFGYVRYLKDQNIVMYTSYADGATTYQHKIGSRTQPTVVYEDSAVQHAGWDANGKPVAFIRG